MDLNDVALFARVVEAGGFTAAARALGLPKTSVSRRIAALERDVGVRLLHRTTRSLRPTEAGRLYYERSAAALRAIEEANRQLAEASEEPVGTLRISAPVGFASYFLADATFEFLATYPRAQVDLLLTDDRLNLVDEGIDLAFRTGALADSTLVARKLGSTKILCAAAVLGAPRHAVDAFRSCRPTASSPATLVGTHWSLEGPEGRDGSGHRPHRRQHDGADAGGGHPGPRYRATPVSVAAAAIRSGKLKRVLRRYAAAVGGLYAVYPSSRHLSPAVKAFVEIAARHISRHSGTARRLDATLAETIRLAPVFAKSGWLSPKAAGRSRSPRGRR